MVFIGWKSPKLSILESFRVRVALQRPGLAGGQWPYRCHVCEAPRSVRLRFFFRILRSLCKVSGIASFGGRGERAGVWLPQEVLDNDLGCLLIGA